MSELMDFGSAIWSEKIAKQVDAMSIENGIPSLDLMEKAGYWVAITAASRAKPGQTIVVLAGPGNNGGDALVAARYLFLWSYQVHVLHLVTSQQKKTPDRVAQEQKVFSLGITSSQFQTASNSMIKDALIIDGVFGIGLNGPLRDGPHKNFLKEINDTKTGPVIAIDLPSGILGDSWEQEPPPLPAQVTISFGSCKPAHLMYPSAKYCGETLVRKIGFSDQAIVEAWNNSEIKMVHMKTLDKNPWRHIPKDSHKYKRGHVLVIGGSPGKFGAPLLSSIAAAQAGAGWVTLATSSPQASVPAHIVEEDLYEHGKLSTPKLKSFIEERKVKAIAVGPGMIQSPLDEELARYLKSLSHNGVSVIIDAGACIDIMSKSLGTFNPYKTLLTPHPGEFLKLGLWHKKIESLRDLPEILKGLDSLGACLFYKTASPICMSPVLDFFPTQSIGQPKLGKAGSGDVLAGLCAALSLTDLPIWQIPFFAMQIQLNTLRHLTKTGLSEPTPLDIANSIRYD